MSAGSIGGAAHALHTNHECGFANLSGGAAHAKKAMIVARSSTWRPRYWQGAEADARSDIFSFGCALYEMTTGRRAFDGKSQVGLLAAILEKRPRTY